MKELQIIVAPGLYVTRLGKLVRIDIIWGQWGFSEQTGDPQWWWLNGCFDRNNSSKTDNDLMGQADRDDANRKMWKFE